MPRSVRFAPRWGEDLFAALPEDAGAIEEGRAGETRTERPASSRDVVSRNYSPKFRVYGAIAGRTVPNYGGKPALPSGSTTRPG
jgi:hypothetical protein